VSKLTEGLGLIEAGIKVFRTLIGTCKEQVTASQGINCKVACLLLRDSEGEEVFVSPDLSPWGQVMFRNSYLTTCSFGHCR
jgi:hypothetical protein